MGLGTAQADDGVPSPDAAPGESVAATEADPPSPANAEASSPPAAAPVPSALLPEAPRATAAPPPELGPRRRRSVSELSDELRALRTASLDTRAALATSVVSAGVVSIVAGALLTIPDDYDQGLRYAGFNTLAFGAVNTVVGAIALVGIEEERSWDGDPARTVETQTPTGFARYRDHAVADESREAWGHGINLGLAAAYGAIGGVAIAASQLGVEHPNRWLGSGIAISAQAAHLLIVDLIGTWKARQYEDEIRALAPSVSYDPASGDTRAGVALSQEF